MSNAASTLVWHHAHAEGSARLVLLAIADHDGEGGAWPSVSTLARMARVSESTVQRAVRVLVATGELTVHTQEGGTARTAEHLRTNRYEINLACPVWCDGTTRHACRECGAAREHRPECPQKLCTGVSPMTPPHPVDNPDKLCTGVSPVTPHPVSLVTPYEPSLEPPLTPPTPPVPTVPSSVAQLWTGEGIAEEDQTALWADVIADPATTVPAARARQRAWFVPALARIKAKRAADTGAALVNVRRYGQPCEHDTPGGAEQHPLTGLPLCPLCRRKAVS